MEKRTTTDGIYGDGDDDMKIYPHPYQPRDQRYWIYDQYSPMTLQEAFRTYRNDVIVNSRQRMRMIKAKETRRQLAKELLLGHQDVDELETSARETEFYRAMEERLEYESKRHVLDRHRELTSAGRRADRRRRSYFDELSRPGGMKQQRRAAPVSTSSSSMSLSHGMSSREIKERTRKKYEKLPEVQQKLLREKLEESKAKNRIKSNIFKKVI